MAIFNSNSRFDPTDWLKEKSLAALEIAASLVDLANEPDTTPWYAKNLKNIGKGLLSRLIPMTALFHGVGEDGVKVEEWQSILEKGTFALAKWCHKWQIVNPYAFQGLTAKQRDLSESEEKSQSAPSQVAWSDSKNSSELKLAVYQHMALQMLHAEITEPAKRLLSWALFHLNTSEYADIVALNKTFLPTDIGCSPQETMQAYRLLYQLGLIEKIEGLDLIEEAIAIKLVVDGINESKHGKPFVEETFGRPGLRIQEKPTTGNLFCLAFDQKLSKYLQWLAQAPEKVKQLQTFLQESIGKDKAYFEDVCVAPARSGPHSATRLEISLRYPFDENDEMMEDLVRRLVEQWLMESMK